MAVPERAELVEAGRNPALEAGDQPGHDLLSLGRVGGLVGVDHILVSQGASSVSKYRVVTSDC
jgi:hypothetical protein